MGVKIPEFCDRLLWMSHKNSYKANHYWHESQPVRKYSRVWCGKKHTACYDVFWSMDEIFFNFRKQIQV